MKTGISSALFVVAAVALQGCGKTNILNTLDVKVTEQNQDQYITLSAKLKLGNAIFDQLQIPVRDPRTGLEVGQLGLSTGTDGLATVSLGVNASVMLHADPSLGSTLPNGREVPVSLGAAPGELLAFPILNYSRVYIGGDLKSQAFIGVALAVKQLDGIASIGGTAANVFFGQQFSPTIYGLAGLYGSPNANQSGIAVFGRVTLQQQPTSSTILTMAAKAASSVRESAKGLAGQISNQAVSDADRLHPRSERKVTNFFYGNRRVIKVQ